MTDRSWFNPIEKQVNTMTDQSWLNQMEKQINNDRSELLKPNRKQIKYIHREIGSSD